MGQLAAKPLEGFRVEIHRAGDGDIQLVTLGYKGREQKEISKDALYVPSP